MIATAEVGDVPFDTRRAADKIAGAQPPELTAPFSIEGKYMAVAAPDQQFIAGYRRGRADELAGFCPPKFPAVAGVESQQITPTGAEVHDTFFDRGSAGDFRPRFVFPQNFAGGSIECPDEPVDVAGKNPPIGQTRSHFDPRAGGSGPQRLAAAGGKADQLTTFASKKDVLPGHHRRRHDPHRMTPKLAAGGGIHRVKVTVFAAEKKPPAGKGRTATHLAGGFEAPAFRTAGGFESVEVTVIAAEKNRAHGQSRRRPDLASRLEPPEGLWRGSDRLADGRPRTADGSWILGRRVPGGLGRCQGVAPARRRNGHPCHVAGTRFAATQNIASPEKEPAQNNGEQYRQRPKKLDAGAPAGRSCGLGLFSRRTCWDFFGHQFDRNFSRFLFRPLAGNRLQRSNFDQQPVSTPRNGLDITRVFGAVPERPAQFPDRVGEHFAGHISAAPDLLEKFLLGEDLPWTRGEDHQQLHHLGFEPRDIPIPLQLVQARMHPPVAQPEALLRHLFGELLLWGRRHARILTPHPLRPKKKRPTVSRGP